MHTTATITLLSITVVLHDPPLCRFPTLRSMLQILSAYVSTARRLVAICAASFLPVPVAVHTRRRTCKRQAVRRARSASLTFPAVAGPYPLSTRRPGVRCGYLFSCKRSGAPCQQHVENHAGEQRAVDLVDRFLEDDWRFADTLIILRAAYLGMQPGLNSPSIYGR